MNKKITMQTETLTEKKCTPCEGKESPLSREDIQPLLEGISDEWNVLEDKKIRRDLKFKDFRENMKFVNEVAELAEDEGHHPDLCISYNKLEMTLTTHAINGLSENDFIMAAKIDEMI